jgi:RsiW-degrading membrane proteinase PrsW (M82 family)
MMLLPIAYITFWMMINSRSLLGDDKPSGLAAIVWNALMLFALAGACAAAGTSIYDRVADTSSPRAILAGRVVLGMVALVLVAVVAGFVIKRQKQKSAGVR